MLFYNGTASFPEGVAYISQQQNNSLMRMQSNQSSELRQGSVAPGFYLSASNDDPN